MAIVGPELEQTRLSLQYPVESLASVLGFHAEPAFLESGQGFGSFGRWSFYAIAPRLVFHATGSRWSICETSGMSKKEFFSIPIEQGEDESLEALGRLIERLGLMESEANPGADAPPFTGGLIGYFGYDLAPMIETLPRKSPPDSRLPDCRFAVYDQVVTVDHWTGAIDLWTQQFPSIRPRKPSQSIESILRTQRPQRPKPSALGPVLPDVGHDDYCLKVGKVLRYIEAGDIFQANLSQRFTSHGQPDPLDLYLRLRQRSPAPFAAMLSWNDLAVVSASPELFYQVRDGRIITRPIKGTRPRDPDAVIDSQHSYSLRTSGKDRAELTMIVDLERNDLGRICEYGSVQVTDPLKVESFAQVHHLVATVEGRLRPEIGPIDVVKAMFPGGSITGAPKIRAMEIIDELEPSRRSLYTGAIGYFGRGGTSAFNIAIRTILVEGNRVSYQVGGGIVADSDPESEYDETLQKGLAMKEVLEASP